MVCDTHEIAKHFACCLFLHNDRGEVVQTMDDEERIIYADIGKFDCCHVIMHLCCCITDLDKLKNIREQIPITKQCREDVYHVVEK